MMDGRFNQDSFDSTSFNSLLVGPTPFPGPLEPWWVPPPTCWILVYTIGIDKSWPCFITTQYGGWTTKVLYHVLWVSSRSLYTIRPTHDIAVCNYPVLSKKRIWNPNLFGRSFLLFYVTIQCVPNQLVLPQLCLDHMEEYRSVLFWRSVTW